MHTLRPHLERHVDGLLHPVDVRGERCDEDPTLPQRDDLAEGLADEPLRPGVAGPLGVRRVAEHEVDAEVAELGETADVRPEAVHGRVVDLVVRRVEDAQPSTSTTTPALSGIECAIRTSSSRNGPCLPGRLPAASRRARYGSVSLCSASFDWTRPSVSGVPMILRHVDLAEEVGQAAHVILVGVREHDGVDCRRRARRGTRCQGARGRRRDARRAGRRARRR